MDETDDHRDLDRDLRRYRLAQRLMCYQARTQTIFYFTALSRHQLALLRNRWSVHPHLRHRGPSPHSLSALFRSPQQRRAATSAAVLLKLFHAIPCRAAVVDRRKFYTLESGERLCEAYEAFRSYTPTAALEFEHVLMLALALAKTDEVLLGNCCNCQATILIDLLSPSRRLCFLCAQGNARAAHEPRIRGVSQNRTYRARHSFASNENTNRGRCDA